MQPEIFFKDEEGIVALTSDASIDFVPADFDSPLTTGQRAYLKSACGVDIPQVFWRKQIHGDDILVASWPEVDETALTQDEIELMIQVNGKLRGSLLVAKDADKAAIEQLALAHEAVQKQLAGGAAKKVIVVPGRLVNVVV